MSPITCRVRCRVAAARRPSQPGNRLDDRDHVALRLQRLDDERNVEVAIPMPSAERKLSALIGREVEIEYAADGEIVAVREVPSEPAIDWKRGA